MARFFMFLLRFMRDRGAGIKDGEFRALWVVLIGAYLFITIDVMADAVLISLRRRWRRAAALDTPVGHHPRAKVRRV